MDIAICRYVRTEPQHRIYFACFMIIGELIAGVRILLEKGPSRYHMPKDQKSPEEIEMLLFDHKLEEARRGAEVGHRGPLPHGGAAHLAVAPSGGEEALAHLC